MADKKEVPKITPMPGMVIVRYQSFREEKTASGLYLGKPKHEGIPNKGKVYAVGSDIKDLSAGDYIIFKYENAKGFQLEDEKLIAVPYENVLATIIEE